MAFRVEDFDAVLPIRAERLFARYPIFLEGQKVLELAACRGGLTRVLASLAREVVALEINPDFSAQIEGPNVRVINGDMHHCLRGLVDEAFGTVSSVQASSITRRTPSCFWR